MSSWYGTSRTNYVQIINLDGLREFLKQCDLNIGQHSSSSDMFAFFAGDMSEDGEWPVFYTVEIPDPEDPDSTLEEEREFDFATDIMPFVAEGQVLVVMSAGAEKQCYVSGYSEAFIRKGEDVQSVSLNLNDIYALAAKTFKVDQSKINDCSY